jgi:hypothetical protein
LFPLLLGAPWSRLHGICILLNLVSDKSLSLFEESCRGDVKTTV